MLCAHLSCLALPGVSLDSDPIQSKRHNQKHSHEVLVKNRTGEEKPSVTLVGKKGSKLKNRTVQRGKEGQRVTEIEKRGTGLS